MRKVSSKKRRIQNVRRQVLFPVIYEEYADYRLSEGLYRMGFCVRCGEPRIPGELDMDEADGHYQGGILSAQLDPTKIQLVCSIAKYGNACHPVGAHHNDWIARHPRLEDRMVALRKMILEFIPPTGGELRPSLKTQEEAIIMAFKDRGLF